MGAIEAGVRREQLEMALCCRYFTGIEKEKIGKHIKGKGIRANRAVWLEPFDPALRDLRVNRAVARFTFLRNSGRRHLLVESS